MAESLKLLGRQMTLSEAREDEDNILQQLTYPGLRREFVISLLHKEDDLLALVAFHLNIDPKLCSLSQVEDWRHGSFNFSIPIYTDWAKRTRVILRIPLPYKVGESYHPGNVDEKLRCEAATYIYIQENADDIPIPKLWAFGLTNGLNFTALEKRSLVCRLYRRLQNCVRSILGYTTLAPYIRTLPPGALNTGYLLLDYVEDGELLSNTFHLYQNDTCRRQTFFRDLSRILLSLAKLSHPRIGSFTINDSGLISLTNRPLTLRLHWLENEGIPTNIDRRTTYPTVDSYALDLLAYHDSRLIYQPNSINDMIDGRQQMSAITLMRSVLLQFILSRRGPYILQPTDIHPSNIFVDQHGRITSVIDWEWACTLPQEMLQPPYWITRRDLDDLTGEALDEFCHVRDEFMKIFEQEEQNLTGDHKNPLTRVIQHSWQLGGFWYFSALSTTKGFYNIFLQHISPVFSNKFPLQDVSSFWRRDAEHILQTKLNDTQKYLISLEDVAHQQRE